LSLVRSFNSFSSSNRRKEIGENAVSLLVEEEDKSLGERDFHLTSEAGQISRVLEETREERREEVCSLIYEAV
jgi:hypothetical protein